MTAEHLSYSDTGSTDPQACCWRRVPKRPRSGRHWGPEGRGSQTLHWDLSRREDAQERGSREETSLLTVCVTCCDRSLRSRALQSVQYFHDLLLDDFCGVACVWYQISGRGRMKIFDKLHENTQKKKIPNYFIDRSD